MSDTITFAETTTEPIDNGVPGGDNQVGGSLARIWVRNNPDGTQTEVEFSVYMVQEDEEHEPFIRVQGAVYTLEILPEQSYPESTNSDYRYWDGYGRSAEDGITVTGTVESVVKSLTLEDVYELLDQTSF